MGEAIKSDIAIIGGGPGGYSAAIHARQRGLQIVLIEKDSIGGTCLNRGCIPTKILLRSVELFGLLQKANDFGIEPAEVRVNFGKIAERKDTVVKKMVSSFKTLLTSHGVKIIKGEGRLASPRQVDVSCPDGKTESVSAGNIILAPGSAPAAVSIAGARSRNVLDSDGILQLTTLPKSLAVIGGGVIGLEFATIFAGLGSQVTVIEAKPSILSTEDEEVVDILRRALKKNGVSIHEETTVTEISDTAGGKTVSYETGGTRTSVAAELVLIAVGRQPSTESLGLDNVPIDTDKGWIKVGSSLETSQPGIYAIGDATGCQQLAHVAFAQAEVAVDSIAGGKTAMRYDLIPRAIYTLPELAAVGLTEQQAREKADNVVTGRFPLIANGRALTMGETQGLVKVMSQKNTGEILGIHICGLGATELIAEAVAVMQMKGTTDDIGRMIHAHPTLSEAVREAALDTAGMAVHILPRRRR